METNEDKVIKLIGKASGSEKSEDAMRFSQSALNCAHAMQVLQEVKIEKPK
ncbi:hypothetical protein LCGC14_1207910 [marine sediment metagenome]|uniref:Uncharacterized protein n=1 Tax=marine sediment metagenome TaxID=412755 RepID=A0A0F9PJM8_9ZZZZ